MAERDKWGKEPAQLYEIHQPLCRARFGETVPGRLGPVGTNAPVVPNRQEGPDMAVSAGDGAFIAEAGGRVGLQPNSFTSFLSARLFTDDLAPTRDGNRTIIGFTAEHYHRGVGTIAVPLNAGAVPEPFFSLRLRVEDNELTATFSDGTVPESVAVAGLIDDQWHRLFAFLIYDYDPVMNFGSYLLEAGFVTQGGTIVRDTVGTIASPAQPSLNYDPQGTDFNSSQSPLAPVSTFRELQVWGRKLTDDELLQPAREIVNRTGLVAWWMWDLDPIVCLASLSENLIPNSLDFGGLLWDKGPNTFQAGTSPVDGRSRLVSMGPSGADLFPLPTNQITWPPGALASCSIGVDYQYGSAEALLTLRPVLETQAGPVPGFDTALSLEIDTETDTVTAQGARVSNVQFQPVAGDYVRVSADFDLSGIPAIEDGAALLYPRFTQTSADFGVFSLARPTLAVQASGQVYATTQGQPLLAGDNKCWNTIGTCKDEPSYTPGEPLVIRFCPKDQAGYPPELRAIPALISQSQSSAQLNVGGVNPNLSPLGRRAEHTATIADFPDSDIITDPYVDERSYIPRERGTFWGKWAARNEYRDAMPVLQRTGYLADGRFVEQHRYRFYLLRLNRPGDVAVITSEDIISKLRADRALFPAPSDGRLDGDLLAADGSFTLRPAGVGSTYPAEFRCRIGGEGFDVERVGDVCTILQRGLYGGLEDHREDDTVQLVERFVAQQVHNIAYRIITTAVPELVNHIDKSAWDAVAAAFLPRLYSADITEPTPTEDLLDELSESTPAYWQADTRTNLIIMDAVRDVASAPVRLDDFGGLAKDRIDITTHPTDRVDAVLVYYGLRDPAGRLDDVTNYAQGFKKINLAERARRGQPALRTVYTRWIGAGGRAVAEEIADALIGRFQATPVRIAFDVEAKRGDLWLGDLVRLVTRREQDATGLAEEAKRYQIIEASESQPSHVFSYVAQSFEFFAPFDPNVINIVIEPLDTEDELGAVRAINLRELYDAAVATEVPDITFTVAGGPGTVGGAVVGAEDAMVGYSLWLPDDWPWSPSITLRIEEGGAVLGPGGNGGRGANLSPLQPAEPGGNGGDALVVDYPNTVFDNRGLVAGGGSGGGGSGLNELSSTAGAGGGAGAGRLPGVRGARGTGSFFNNLTSYTEAGDATLLEPGRGGEWRDRQSGALLWRGGDGGELGEAGTPGQTVGGGSPPVRAGAPAGTPGRAIVGYDNLNPIIRRGDIRGETV